MIHTLNTDPVLRPVLGLVSPDDYLYFCNVNSYFFVRINGMILDLVVRYHHINTIGCWFDLIKNIHLRSTLDLVQELLEIIPKFFKNERRTGRMENLMSAFQILRIVVNKEDAALGGNMGAYRKEEGVDWGLGRDKLEFHQSSLNMAQRVWNHMLFWV